MILCLNAKGPSPYNSFIEFNEEIRETIDTAFGVLLEIEFLSKHEERTKDGFIRYSFNVTKKKEVELTAIFTSQINCLVIESIPILLN